MSKATPPVPSAPVVGSIDTSSPLEEFLEANFKKLVLLFAVIAIGAVLYGIISYTSRANAVAAGEAFASAKTVEDCDKVISEYSGTLAAGNALLLKADLLWTENKKDSSVAALREFTTKNTDHPLMAEALVGLGSKLESIGKADEAQPVFQRVTTEFASSDVAALAQLRLGDLLWAAGKEEEAKAAYEAVGTKFVKAAPAFLDQGESRLKWIAAKLPTKEVDGPPKPKVAPPAPGVPQINLNAAPGLPGSLTPQLQVPSPMVTAPAAPTIEVTPGPVVPAPAPVAPKIEMTPAPATPAVPVPAPAAPKVEVTPAPAATPAVPAVPAPEAPKIEVKPAPAVPAPVPAPSPAPVPAPAQPATPAPAAPAKAAS